MAYSFKVGLVSVKTFGATDMMEGKDESAGKTVSIPNSLFTRMLTASLFSSFSCGHRFSEC